MSSWSPACKDCVLSGGECLFQSSDDVESCEDVREYELEKIKNKEKDEG